MFKKALSLTVLLCYIIIYLSFDSSRFIIHLIILRYDIFLYHSLLYAPLYLLLYTVPVSPYFNVILLIYGYFGIWFLRGSCYCSWVYSPRYNDLIFMLPFYEIFYFPYLLLRVCSLCFCSFSVFRASLARHFCTRDI